MKATSNGHLRTLLACAILVGLILLAYHRVASYPFVAWDDGVFVKENARVNTGVSWDNFRWSWGIHGPGQWHPLAWWSHQLDCQWFGLDAGRHHVTNLVIHIFGTLALLAALMRLTGNFWPSLLVAALFALHPLSVESVAWIAERRDVLSTLFLGLTLWAYAGYAQRGGWRRYLLTMALLALGLMAKPMLVTLPCLLLLLDYWPLRRFRPLRESGSAARPAAWLVVEKLPLFVLAMISAWLSYHCQQVDGSIIALSKYPLSFRLANAALSYVLYLRNMIWPWHLAPVYPLPKSFAAWQLLGATAVLLAISAAAVWQARRRPYLLVGWLWYIGTLLPVIGLLRMGTEVAMADRYAYVPLIGIYIAVAWGLNELTLTSVSGRWAVGAAALGMVIACTILTSRQVGFWKDSVTLFERAIAVAPKNPIAYGNLGHAYQLEQPERAILHFRESLRLNPNQPAIENEWGNVLRSQGIDKIGEAIEHYQAALRIEPNLAVAHDNLGSAYWSLGDLKKSKLHHQQAVSSNPEFGPAHYNLANVLRHLGETDSAIKHYREALRLDPNETVVLINLGNVLHAQGDIDEAITLFRKAAKLKPSEFEAHVSLGNALLGLGQIDEAMAHYEMAQRLNSNSAEVHLGLGSALAAQRRLAEAIEHFRTALRIQPDIPAARENLRRAEAELQSRP